jgi:hypothetical protein
VVRTLTIVRDLPAAGPLCGIAIADAPAGFYEAARRRVTTVLGFTISRERRYRVYGLLQFPNICLACALFDV